MISANLDRQSLAPPAGYQCLNQGDLVVLNVGGPNLRRDFHVNPSEEFLIQLHKSMNLKIITDGRLQTIPIHAGESYLIPAYVPHYPERPEGSMGLVVERKRQATESESFLWVCELCCCTLHQEILPCADLEIRLASALHRGHRLSARKKCPCLP